MPNDTLPGSTDASADTPGDTTTGAATLASARRRLAARLVRGMLWSMLGIAALGLTRLVYTALLGRTGDPARLAEINAQVSLAFFATFATAAATGAGAAKFLPVATARWGPAAAVGVRRKLSLWTLAGTGLVVGLLGVAGRWVLPGAGWLDVATACALTAAYSAYTFAKSVLYGHDLARRYAVLEVGADLAILALTVAAVAWAPPQWRALLVLPLVIGYAGFALAAAASTPRWPGESSEGRPSRQQLRQQRQSDQPREPGRQPRQSRPQREPMPPLGTELGGFVAFTALGIAAGQGFFQVSMVVAGHTTAGAEAGVYAAAMALVGPAFFLPRALALAFFPAAAEAVGRGDGAALARHTATVTRVLAVSMLPAFTLAAMLGGPALGLVFGPSYAGGGAVFAILVLAVLLYVIAVPSVNVLSAYDLSLARIPPLASTVGVVLGALTWLVVTPRLGAVGIAVGYLAAMVVQAGIPVVVAFRRLGLVRVRRIARYAATGAAGIALAGLAVAVPRIGVTTGCVVAFGAVFAVLQGREVAGTVRAVRRLAVTPTVTSNNEDSVPTQTTDTA
ncbi:lipid II flippase MurJ [Actinopolymorpha sp. B17G11]|uniref:lipopolysaccharide biosynthesis protein n=1 Tax=unclassified Actinopolymorpha TaxID=2627063 RepID=UPI0032D8CEAD